jgi:hypothetical protein
VLVGTPHLWDQSLALQNVQSEYNSYTWSPCGQFVAVQTEKAVEIHDPVTFGLLSTLQPTEHFSQLIGALAYSPDGHLLASLSKTSLIIWDIQTGGVTKEILCDEIPGGSLVWSLDGRAVSTTAQGWDWDVYTYDITSGTRLSPGQLHSSLNLWAHDTSLRAMTIEQDGKAYMIDILEVGSVFIKVESFHIPLGTRNSWVKFFLGEEHYQARSFSPTTYRISMHTSCQLLILDIRNSECLLEQEGNFESHSFSSDGSLFAASLWNSAHIWKYTSPCYTLWRELPLPGSDICCPFTLQFSPTLSSIMGQPTVPGYKNTLQVWYLDGPPIVAHPKSHQSLAIPSSCGTYVVVGCRGDSTITITNLLSQPPHFIETGMRIDRFALTGNILLVEDSKMIVAWKLCGSRKAGWHNKLWTIPQHNNLRFMVEDQTVTIWDTMKQECIKIYNPGTGEILEPIQAPPYNPHHEHTSYAMYLGQHYTHYYRLNNHNTCPEDNWPVSLNMFQEEWVKDPEGKHRLWIPVNWRKHTITGGWLHNIATLNLYNEGIIIKF